MTDTFRQFTRPFQPNDIGALRLWFLADGIYGIASGAGIPTWPDLSPAHTAALQATGIKQPLFTPKAVNTHASALYDKSDDNLVTPTIAHGVGTGDWTFWAVARASNVAGSYQALASNGSAAPACYIHSTHPHVYWAGDKPFAATLTNNVWYLLYWQRIGTTVSCYVNGILDATTYTISTSMADAAWIIGAESASGASSFGGDIVELAFYSGALTAPQRQHIEQYIRLRYQIF